MPSGSGGPGRARDASSPSERPRPGAPDDAHRTVDELEIGLGDLEEMRGQPSRLVATTRAATSAALPATTALRLAYVPDPERDQRGVAVLHADVGRLQAQLVGDDLRQRGGRSLAVRRRAGDEQRLSRSHRSRSIAPSYGPSPVSST